jgi:hypothetical protein
MTLDLISTDVSVSPPEILSVFDFWHRFFCDAPGKTKYFSFTLGASQPQVIL